MYNFYVALVSIICFSVLFKEPLTLAKNTVTVEMQGHKFVAKELKIRRGQTVRWVNKSKMFHNVVAEDKSFRSRLLKEGQEFEYKFDKKGKFDYYCEPHKSMGMVGKVIVE